MGDAAADAAADVVGATAVDKEGMDKCSRNWLPCNQTQLLATVEERTVVRTKTTCIVSMLPTIIAAATGTTSKMTTSAPPESCPYQTTTPMQQTRIQEEAS